jgi:hypothetical protein
MYLHGVTFEDRNLIAPSALLVGRVPYYSTSDINSPFPRLSLHNVGGSDVAFSTTNLPA